MKQKENLDAMIKFAEANGFDIQVDEDPNPDSETEEILKKRAAIESKIKEERERMMRESFIPPPLELIKKKYTTNEPARTGFNEILIPIKIRNNYENFKSQQGPQIRITKTSVQRNRLESRQGPERSQSKASSRGIYFSFDKTKSMASIKDSK